MNGLVVEFLAELCQNVVLVLLILEGGQLRKRTDLRWPA